MHFKYNNIYQPTKIGVVSLSSLSLYLQMNVFHIIFLIPLMSKKALCILCPVVKVTPGISVTNCRRVFVY